MKRLLFLSVLALAVTACGPKGGSNPDHQDPIIVQPYSYEGEPGEFAGRYQGSCVVTTATKSDSNCTALVRVEQSPTRLQVKTQWTIGRNGRNGRARTEETVDIFRVEGKTLVSRRNESGTIGSNTFGFGNQATGEGFVFQRRTDGKFEFITTGSDSRGRKFSVYGTVSKRPARR